MFCGNISNIISKRVRLSVCIGAILQKIISEVLRHKAMGNELMNIDKVTTSIGQNIALVEKF